jgi:hypothetical protein
MAINPSIALGFRPTTELQIQSPINQMAQLMQLRQAQSQNELAQYQLGAAQRAEEQQSNLYNASRKPDFKLDFQTAIQYGPPGIAAYKAQQDVAKTQGELDAQARQAATSRADAFSTALAPLVVAVQAKKPITHQDVFGQANRLVAQGLLRKEDLAAIPMNAAELPNFVMNMATATENSRKALQAYMPEALVAGGNIVNKNPLAAGGIGNVLGDVSMTKFEAGRLPIMQQQANIAAGQLNVSQGQLNVARDRLAQENQGVTYQQNAQGNFVALPTRLSSGATPVAKPVTGEGGEPVKGKPSAFAEKTAAQRAQMSKDLGFAITQLSDITKDGGLIDQSTGSGVGRLADIGAGFVGKATPGAIAIGKIAPVADLVLKMVPRFEGPQSNKDTQSYKEAAGQLADATLPTEIRKEAGKTVLRLMQERKNQFVTNDMAAQGVAPTQIAPPPGFTPD